MNPEVIKSIFILLNIVLIESLLSVDNAAVLAVMVKVLPEDQRGKALKWGIGGAFIFRGICLLLASYLVKILWLKILGGAYLLYLTYDFFSQKKEEEETGDTDKTDGVVSSFLKRTIGLFWGTVILVEIADLSFSIDNIFAAVALTPNIYLIMAGVFVGILAMRFVAQRFVKLLEKYPELEATTFVVIGLLGVKLVLSGIFDYTKDNAVKHVLNHEYTDMVFSLLVLVVFMIPVVRGYFRNKNSGGNGATFNTDSSGIKHYVGRNNNNSPIV